MCFIVVDVLYCVLVGLDVGEFEVWCCVGGLGDFYDGVGWGDVVVVGVVVDFYEDFELCVVFFGGSR